MDNRHLLSESTSTNQGDRRTPHPISRAHTYTYTCVHIRGCTHTHTHRGQGHLRPSEAAPAWGMEAGSGQHSSVTSFNPQTLRSNLGAQP